MRPPRVLIVDDSAVVRSVLSRGFAAAGLEVAGVAADPFVARDLILLRHPDVLTLDLEMPRMDGLSFLERLMRHHPLPVVVVSSLTEARSAMALKALELGAVDVVAKPSQSLAQGLSGETLQSLVEKVQAAARSRPRPRRLRSLGAGPSGGAKRLLGTTSDKLAVIGASTGGTEALAELLEGLPPDHPGVLVVQHMPPYFTRTFAERLDQTCAMRVREAKDGDAVTDGTVLIAPGNYHMLLKRTGAKYRVECRQGPLVHHVRPSVDVLFHSAAREAGANAAGVILTGMGKDGAEGLLAMRRAGSPTFAQDEASCVVYGMPKEAVACGAVQEIVPLSGMAEALTRTLSALRQAQPTT